MCKYLSGNEFFDNYYGKTEVQINEQIEVDEGAARKDAKVKGIEYSGSIKKYKDILLTFPDLLTIFSEKIVIDKLTVSIFK